MDKKTSLFRFSTLKIFLIAVIALVVGLGATFLTNSLNTSEAVFAATRTITYDYADGRTTTASVADGNAFTLPDPGTRTGYEFNGWHNDAALKTTISTKQELIDFRDGVNAGTIPTEGLTFVLTADINMSGVNWTPINGFAGNFNGQGHTISNLTMTVSSSSYSTVQVVSFLICNMGIINSTQLIRS